MEITSPGCGDRPEAKLRSCARAGIPLSSLIDRFAPRRPTVTLFSEPEGDAYQEAHSAPFGKPVDLPDPFGVTLTTEDFPR